MAEQQDQSNRMAQLEAELKKLKQDFSVHQHNNSDGTIQLRKTTVLDQDQLYVVGSSQLESQQFFNALVTTEVNKRIIDSWSKPNGRSLSGSEIELMRGVVADGMRGKNIDIPDDFFDFEYSVDVVVTGEQIDLQQRATALQTAFQVIGSNPTILQDPIVRRTYFKLLEATGVNPSELFDEEMPSLMGVMQSTMPASAPMVAQRGGSIAAAPTPPLAQTGKVPTSM